MKKISTRVLVLHALFVGIIFLFGLTPIGYITLPIATITMVHIPVIIGGYVFKLRSAALFGFTFGLTSLIACFTQPDAIAAIVLGTNTGFGLYNIFLIIVILFLPRILVGVFSAMSFNALKKWNETLALAISAAIGSLTNTVFLLGGLYIFAFEQIGGVLGLAPGYTSNTVLAILLGIVTFNGLLEAGAAVIICTPAGKAILHLLKRNPID